MPGGVASAVLAGVDSQPDQGYLSGRRTEKSGVRIHPGRSVQGEKGKGKKEPLRGLAGLCREDRRRKSRQSSAVPFRDAQNGQGSPGR